MKIAWVVLFRDGQPQQCVHMAEVDVQAPRDVYTACGQSADGRSREWDYAHVAFEDLEHEIITCPNCADITIGNFREACL